MKLIRNMVLTELGDEYILVPVGNDQGELSGIIRLNETAAEIWKALEAGLDEKQAAARLTEQYEGVDEEQAGRAVRKVVEQLRAEGFLED